VDALPESLDLRLAGWLRGARAGKILARLRFPRRVVKRVERLLLRHPVHAHVDPTRDASLRRFLGKMGDEDAEALLALRHAELEVAGQAPQEEMDRLASLREGFERVRRSGALALQRSDLALDGAAVMAILGTGPGRAVGRALRALTEAVLEDPTRNTPEALGEILVAWWRDEQEQREAR
jgi:hypothetical protein